MNIKQLIAEIETDLRQYSDAGLIDYRNLKRWINSEVKRFGSNLMTVKEEFLEIKDGKAELPDDFFSLDLACKIDKESHYFNNDCQEIVESSSFWKQRLETTYVWDNQSNSHKQEDFKCIEEKIVRDDCSVTLRYTNPTLLKLVKGVKRASLSKYCKNFKVQKSPYEINISGNTLYFNFNKGVVYIQYDGLPTDEDGNLEIPEIRSLEEYLIAYCRRKILEGMYYNDEDTNLINKLQLAKQDERELYGLAQTAVKLERLSKNWDEKIIQANRRNTQKYERLFPNQR
jgi:hypothetical protein